jgi:hypothetical protein
MDQFYRGNYWRQKMFSGREQRMKGKIAALLLSGLLAACAQPQATGGAAATTPSAAPASRPVAAPSVVAAPAPAAPAPAAPPAPTQAAKVAPVNHVVNIQRAGCRDLLRLSPDDRAAASMFYIGYQASRSRSRTINVGVIPSIEAQALTYCTENPQRTLAQVFAEAYARVR